MSRRLVTDEGLITIRDAGLVLKVPHNVSGEALQRLDTAGNGRSSHARAADGGGSTACKASRTRAGTSADGAKNSGAGGRSSGRRDCVAGNADARSNHGDNATRHLRRNLCAQADGRTAESARNASADRADGSAAESAE
ncbi:hypothetical protein G6016_00595 [Dietzia aerolata]|uniref:Uncharacterized protein n=1 Tax=Dietzia aerolata TaxID=595984 RepID=A0ABV5JWD5_9ACTN|nr:hypothetical protein [Dietzia aerolata]MBB0967481.1 hypothetical protein [Dietzia aerolata]